MTDITAEITALRELSTDDLVAKYRDLHGNEPRIRHREWIWKRLAWKLQEQRFGGLSRIAHRKLEQLMERLDLPFDQPPTPSPTAIPKALSDLQPGTVLTREYRGRDVHAIVRDDGIEAEGKVHKSLSAAAKAVTGSHWNGRLFWGVEKRRAR